MREFGPTFDANTLKVLCKNMDEKISFIEFTHLKSSKCHILFLWFFKG